ncbi:Protein of unknown function [Gryllus bimaculatus]|nr:Protein of unknown function [Gryllus bimaculatus]
MASRKTRQSKRDASPALRSRAATAAAAQAAALAADPHPLAAPHVSLAGTYGLHEMRKLVNSSNFNDGAAPSVGRSLWQQARGRIGFAHRDAAMFPGNPRALSSARQLNSSVVILKFCSLRENGSSKSKQNRGMCGQLSGGKKNPHSLNAIKYILHIFSIGDDVEALTFAFESKIVTISSIKLFYNENLWERNGCTVREEELENVHIFFNKPPDNTLEEFRDKYIVCRGKDDEMFLLSLLVFFFVSLIGSNNHINRKYKSKNICNGIVLINV